MDKPENLEIQLEVDSVGDLRFTCVHNTGTIFKYFFTSAICRHCRRKIEEAMMKIIKELNP